jgi:hypothetical protein
MAPTPGESVPHLSGMLIHRSEHARQPSGQAQPASTNRPSQAQANFGQFGRHTSNNTQIVTKRHDPNLTTAPTHPTSPRTPTHPTRSSVDADNPPTSGPQPAINDNPQPPIRLKGEQKRQPYPAASASATRGPNQTRKQPHNQPPTGVAGPNQTGKRPTKPSRPPSSPPGYVATASQNKTDPRPSRMHPTQQRCPPRNLNQPPAPQRRSAPDPSQPQAANSARNPTHPVAYFTVR